MEGHDRRAMREAKRTQVAQTAFDFSTFFQAMMTNVVVSGGAPRRPVLVAPEGMSTAGGRQARQSLCLQPDFPGFATITCGWVDVGSGQAQLRTHFCLEQMHRQRFGNRPFDVERTTYQAFFAKAQQLLAGRGIQCVVENAPPQLEGPPLGEISESGWSTNAVLGLCGLFFVLGSAAGAATMYLYLTR
jgi:hypothetical protein